MMFFTLSSWAWINGTCKSGHGKCSHTVFVNHVPDDLLYLSRINCNAFITGNIQLTLDYRLGLIGNTRIITKAVGRHENHSDLLSFILNNSVGRKGRG